MKISRLPAVLLVLILIGSAVAADDVTVRADVDRNRVDMNSQFNFTVSVTGASGNIKQPDLGAIENFRVMGSSTSSRISIINGRMQSSRDFRYTLLPRKKGTFTIPPVEVEVNGKTYKTGGVRIEVVEGSRPQQGTSGREPRSGGGQNTADEGGLEKDIFAKAEVSARKVYPGEQIDLRFLLYSRYVPSAVEAVEKPDYKDFIVEEVDIKNSEATEMKVIDGKAYRVYFLKHYLLFPARTGKLTVDPLVLGLNVNLRSADPFDNFFFGRDKTVYRRTSPVEIEVVPLPERGKPANFNGAVGKFSISSDLSAGTAEVNDAVTLSVNIIGTGNLNALESVTLPALPDFEVHDPESTRNVVVEKGRMEGMLRWRYILIPGVAGEYEIPALDFSYFDPEKEVYKTVSTRPLSLNVTGSAGEVTVNDGKRSIKSLEEDIRFIKPYEGPLEDFGASFMPPVLFFGLLAVPAAINIVFFFAVWRRTKRMSRKDIIKARRAKSKALKKINTSAGLENNKDRIDRIMDALLEYFADKFSVSPRGLTTVDIEKMLAGEGIDKKVIDDFIGLINLCEGERYSPSQTAQNTVEEAADKAPWIIGRLEKELKR